MLPRTSARRSAREPVDPLGTETPHSTIGVWAHPVNASQLSAVQGSLSSQDAVLSMLRHPIPGSQESSVQRFASPQSGADPPTQLPRVHTSSVVHASPSSQAAVLFAKTHPIPESQVSFVHPFASSQVIGAPPVHVPSAHTSAIVQALPSSQAFVLCVLTQPIPALQESSVQEFASSQSSPGPAEQVPNPSHWSTSVQASPSSQLLPASSNSQIDEQQSPSATFPSSH